MLSGSGCSRPTERIRRLEPGEPRRQLEQRRQELPVGESQQERSLEREQQSGLPGCSQLTGSSDGDALNRVCSGPTASEGRWANPSGWCGAGRRSETAEGPASLFRAALSEGLVWPRLTPASEACHNSLCVRPGWRSMMSPFLRFQRILELADATSIFAKSSRG